MFTTDKEKFKELCWGHVYRALEKWCGEMAGKVLKDDGALKAGPSMQVVAGRFLFDEPAWSKSLWDSFPREVMAFAGCPDPGRAYFIAGGVVYDIAMAPLVLMRLVALEPDLPDRMDGLGGKCCYIGAWLVTWRDDEGFKECYCLSEEDYLSMMYYLGMKDVDGCQASFCYFDQDGVIVPGTTVAAQ